MVHMVLTGHMVTTARNQSKKVVIQGRNAVEKDSINGDNVAP